MDRERLDGWCERGVVGLVTLILVFGPLGMGAVWPREFLVIQGLTIAVLLLWLARLWVNPEFALFWPPVCWGVTAFLIYAVVRYQQADLEYVARQELIRILVYAALFFAIVTNLRRTGHTQIMTFAVVLLGVGLSIFAVYQYASHYPKIWHFVKPAGYLSRGSGTYFNPNHFSGFLEMVLPLALAGALTSRLSHVGRIVLGYGGGVLVVGIGVTGSRGAWVASSLTLLVLLGVLFFQSRFRLRAALALALILGTAGYFFYRFGPPPLRWQQTFAHGQWIDARRRIWQTAWDMWQDHFWFGLGPGHFDYRFPEYRAPLVLFQMDPLYVHNDYLNTLVDWGLVGALIIGTTWLLIGAGLFKRWRAIRRSVQGMRSNKLALLLGAGCGLLAILMHSFTDFNLQVPANAILMVVLMALLATHFRAGEDGCQLSLRWPGKTLVGIVIFLGVVYLGRQEWRKTEECLWLERAGAAKRRQNLDEARLALERAFRVDPWNFGTAYAIGEIFRAQSFAGNQDYQAKAEAAMSWLRRSAALNPYDAYSVVRLGMCLDWIGKAAEAEPYFDRANRLDPNGYHMRMLQGWHCVQIRDYASAKIWLERSLELRAAYENPAAAHYLEIVNRELAKRAPPPAPP